MCHLRDRDRYEVVEQEEEEEEGGREWLIDWLILSIK